MKKELWTTIFVLLFIGSNGFAGDGDLIVNGKLGLGTTNPTGVFEISGQVSYSTNAIPTMTSNTTPSGIVSADSIFSSNYDAWKAMDHTNPNTEGNCWHSARDISLPHWLQYQFSSEKTVTSYTITSRNIPGSYDPTAWKLQGSNNGSSWTDLDSQTGQSFIQNQKKTYTISNTTAYFYYRLYITASNDSSNIYVSIGEFELMETAETTQPLFFVDSTTGNVGIGTTSPGNYNLYVNGTIYANSYSGSDKRWKKNIKPISNALSLVEKLQGVRFEWRTEEFKDKNFEKGGQVGLIAQDVEPVIPEIVKTDKDGYKAIAYEKLTAILVEAIKEQNQKIKELEAKIKKKAR